MNCIRTGTFVLTAVLALICVASATGATRSGTQQLLLEIWLNGRTSHVIAKVIDRDGEILVNAVDLGAAGIKIGPAEADADGFVVLGKLSGVQARLLGEEQKLQLTADAERLVPQDFDLAPPATPPEPPGTPGAELGIAIVRDFPAPRRAFGTPSPERVSAIRVGSIGWYVARLTAGMPSVAASAPNRGAPSPVAWS